MLNLASNILCHNCCVKLRFLNLKDIDLNIFLVKPLQLLLQLVNILSTFANNKSWAGSANSNGDKLQSAFDNNTSYASLSQTLIEILANLLILYKIISKTLAAEPI